MKSITIKYLLTLFISFFVCNISSKDLKIAVLKYGSVNWELNVLKHHELDKKFDLNIKSVQMTNKDAAAIAFLSGAVDIFVTDWIWVSKQRYNGKKVSFLPYSSAAGGLVVKENKKVESLKDLKNKKVGVAGGSIDKSWIFFKAFFQKKFGEDPTSFFNTSFAAPPLINGLLRTGDLDAGINYWNYVARLEAQGFKSIIYIEDILPTLGIYGDLPLIGYVFKEDLMLNEKDLFERFLKATKESREILKTSDEEWHRIKKLTGAKSDEMLRTIKEGFRSGIPRNDNQILKENITKAYKILKDIGGQKLVGKGDSLSEGTIWNVK